MPLITPITDRNQSDVNYAQVHPDSSTPNRGALNYTDLNRIESNCEYLAGQLLGYGYSVSISVKTDWTVYDFPPHDQIDRIRRNVDALINGYHRMVGSLDIRYWESLDWQDVNTLEQHLKNVDDILIKMIAGLRYSGEICSGEDDYR